jgi:hypothetical protein
MSESPASYERKTLKPEETFVAGYRAAHHSVIFEVDNDPIMAERATFLSM